MTSLFFRHLIFWLVALLMVAEARAHEGHRFERSRISMKLKSKSFWSVGLGSFTDLDRNSSGGYRNYYGGVISRHLELSPYREVRTSLTVGSTVETSNSYFGLLTVGGALLLPLNQLTPYVGAEIGGGLEAFTEGIFAAKLVAGIRLKRANGRPVDLGFNYIDWSSAGSGIVGFQVGVSF